MASLTIDPVSFQANQGFFEEDKSGYAPDAQQVAEEDLFVPWDFAGFNQESSNFLQPMQNFDVSQSLNQATQIGLSTPTNYNPKMAVPTSFTLPPKAMATQIKSTPTLKRKVSELSNLSSASSESENEDGAVKKPKRKRSPRLTPEEKARRKLERQIARRQRKSIREKERRNNVNQLFDEMAKMLGLPKEVSDRRSILSKAIETFVKCGIAAPVEGANNNTPAPTTTPTPVAAATTTTPQAAPKQQVATTPALACK